MMILPMMRLVAVLAAMSFAAALAQEKAVVFQGGLIYPVGKSAITNGVVVVQGGKILAIGSADEVKAPADAQVIDCQGKVLTPGFIDTHSHIGQVDVGEFSNPIQPELRAMDSINVEDASLQRARSGGITTVNIMPGSGNLMSGQTVYLKLRQGKKLEDLLMTNRYGTIAGGLKMANGTNPLREPPFPTTRGKSAALVRQKFIAAQEYRDKIKRATNDVDKLPARDLSLEVLVEVLDGKRVVHHHTHRSDDILTVLRLQKEFGFKLVLQHVSEGYKIAQEIAEAKVPCSLIVIDSPGGKLEARDMDWRNAVTLDRAGVTIGFHTDDWVTDSRIFNRSAALAVRAGLPRDKALSGLTLAGAVMMDMAERVGTLEVGKDADVLVLSGDPFSVYTHVEQTWVEGAKVFDRLDPKDLLIATGGLGAGQPRRANLCCFANEQEHQ